MSGIIVPFVGVPERTARKNLSEYILYAKALGYFQGADAIRWPDRTWDLRSKIITRNHCRSLVLNFTTWETSRLKRSQRVVLPKDYADACKALVATTIASGKVSAPIRRLQALKIVERAFRELGRPADIRLLDHAVLDKAARMVLEKGTDKAGILPALAQVAEEISAKGLSVIVLSWQNPAPPERHQRRSVKVTEDGGSAISEKLPHIKCVLDLASVFHGAQAGDDQVTTGWFALSMYAPSRATEVLTLPLECATQMDGVFGLSWVPLKGGEPMTKFATNPEWAEIAGLAVERLRKLGEQARTAAAWYTQNKDYLYLPPGFEHLRWQPVTEFEIRNILGIKNGRFSYTQLSRLFEPTRHGTSDPARTGGMRWNKLYEYHSLERYVLQSLPDNFPWADEKQGLLLKDALFCVPRHTMRSGTPPLCHVPQLIVAGQISDDLNNVDATIFARHDLKDPKTGKHWKLSTHQPRHFLNTLAQAKHLSQALIAFWSGRKSVDQNSWYDHVPPEALIELFVALGEDAPRPIKAVGPLAEKVEQRARKEMISPTDAMRLEVGSIIMTRYGMCRHNYALTPCPKDKNCIGCGENTFLKGNERHLAEARSQLALAERAVQNCLTAIAAGEPGVDAWLAKHQKARERWALAIDRLLDPSIENGTLITLPAPNHSQTKTGLSLNIRESEASELDEMLSIAGES